MRRQLISLAALPAKQARPRRPSARFVCWQCRNIQIGAAPAIETPSHRAGGGAFEALSSGGRDSADARFEVLGSPYSLLSVTLSASQKLYTRRGSLVSVAGKVDNAQSTLSLLAPLRRGFLGIPFLYQRISSTTPITALIATKSASTTMTILHLDGTTDWIVAQRNALLAWTGHTLSVSPRTQRGLSLAHWGNSHLTGRGLAALAAPGHIYEVLLGENEELVVHPSHIVAYSVNKNPPQPFRLKSSSLRLQIPTVPVSITNRVPDVIPLGVRKFWNSMRDTDSYRFLGKVLFALRASARRSIWGDRLFLQFRGPTTLLISSRGVRSAEVLTREHVNEIADTEAGVVPAAIELATTPKEARPARREETPVKMHVATVKGGKVQFEDTKDMKEFVQ